MLHALGTTWTIVRAYYEIGEPSDDRDRDRDREPAERCPGRKGKSLEDQAEAHGGVVKRTAYVYRVPPGGPDEPIARKVFRFDFADGTKTIRQKITPEFRETPVLYKQARVENAIAAGKPVYVCEGEKAVDRLNAHFRELAGPGGKLPALPPARPAAPKAGHHRPALCSTAQSRSRSSPTTTCPVSTTPAMSATALTLTLRSQSSSRPPRAPDMTSASTWTRISVLMICARSISTRS